MLAGVFGWIWDLFLFPSFHLKEFFLDGMCVVRHIDRNEVCRRIQGHLEVVRLTELFGCGLLAALEKYVFCSFALLDIGFFTLFETTVLRILHFFFAASLFGFFLLLQLGAFTQIPIFFLG